MEQGWRRETQSFSGSEQDDFGVEGEQAFHVGFTQGGNVCGRPVFQQGFWQDDEVFFVFLMVDRNMIVTVSGE